MKSLTINTAVNNVTIYDYDKVWAEARYSYEYFKTEATDDSLDEAMRTFSDDLYNQKNGVNVLDVAHLTKSKIYVKNELNKSVLYRATAYIVDGILTITQDGEYMSDKKTYRFDVNDLGDILEQVRNNCETAIKNRLATRKAFIEPIALDYKETTEILDGDTTIAERHIMLMYGEDVLEEVREFLANMTVEDTEDVSSTSTNEEDITVEDTVDTNEEEIKNMKTVEEMTMTERVETLKQMIQDGASDDATDDFVVEIFKCYDTIDEFNEDISKVGLEHYSMTDSLIQMSSYYYEDTNNTDEETTTMTNEINTEEVLDELSYDDAACAAYILKHHNKVKKQFENSCIKEEVIEYYEDWCERNDVDFNEYAEQALDQIYAEYQEEEAVRQLERERAEADRLAKLNAIAETARKYNIPFFDIFTGLYYDDVAAYEIKDDMLDKYTQKDNGLYDEVSIDDMKCMDIEVSRDIAVARKCEVEQYLEIRTDKEIWAAVKREAYITQYNTEQEEFYTYIEELESRDADAAEDAYFAQEEIYAAMQEDAEKKLTEKKVDHTRFDKELTNDEIDLLIQKLPGAKRWQKDGKDRLYIHFANLGLHGHYDAWKRPYDCTFFGEPVDDKYAREFARGTERSSIDLKNGVVVLCGKTAGKPESQQVRDMKKRARSYIADMIDDIKQA